LLETQLLHAIHHDFSLNFAGSLQATFPPVSSSSADTINLSAAAAHLHAQIRSPQKQEASKAGEQTQSTIAQETLRCNALRAYSANANYGQVNAQPNHSYYIRAFILVKILPLFSLPKT
jgi:hypothetical protein